MSLNLYMLGVIVKDMAKSVEFYRRLGVAIPEGSEKNDFVGIKMDKLTFFLSTREQNKIWDKKNKPVESNEGYKMILEFYLKTKDSVDKKFQELKNYGYEVYLEPLITPFNVYFAFIKDPDGNQILLSGEL